MNKEAQRAAIADFCGWQKDQIGNCYAYYQHGDKASMRGAPPDYPNDLNWMQSAARLLALQGWRCVANMGLDGTWECFFTRRENQRVIPTEGDHYGAGDSLSEALAEAFLRVTEKWTEDEKTIRF